MGALGPQVIEDMKSLIYLMTFLACGLVEPTSYYIAKLFY